MGSEDTRAHADDGEGPVRPATVAPFALGATPVTNVEFASFVQDTRHATEAEAYGWSFVFQGFVAEPERFQRVTSTPWWIAVPGATWDHPTGPASDLDGLDDHPVVHVSWNDASAYAVWAGARLPTEVEWEYAARGGLEQATYAWGDELTPSGRHMANIWQGTFPTTNTADDGFIGTSPVRTYPPNGFGLYDVSGNVWEWCQDPWTVGDKPQPGDSRVIRGGSYLCHDSYCNRYRVAARTSNTPDSSSGNTGFRIAR